MSQPTTTQDMLGRTAVKCAAIVIGKMAHPVTGAISYDAWYNGEKIAENTTLSDCLERAGENATLRFPI